jgi:DNA-binding MarR family transcriptional regulator
VDSVFSGPPATGDPERDRLLGEIFALHERMRTLSVELVGPFELPPDLTMQQLRVLGLVAQEPGLTGQELGARLGVSAPTASGLIDRLVEKGVLERTDDAADRRRRRLRLTPEGVELLGGIDATMGRMFEAVIPPIPTEDLQAIKLGTEAMLRAIEAALANRPV